MSTANTLLALLEPEAQHGYTLKQRYDAYFALRRPLAFGQVYATLGRLERDGLAELAEVEPGAGPERRLYRITADGVTRVDEWVLTPQPPQEYAASSLHARVTIALLSGRDADRVLADQRALHLVRMRELLQQRRSATGSEGRQRLAVHDLTRPVAGGQCAAASGPAGPGPGSRGRRVARRSSSGPGT